MEDIKEYKWIFIQKTGKSPSGKTDIFEVREKEDGITIGTIKWFPRWRKYAFFPEEDTIYEEDCLNDISDFLKRLKQERENGR